MIALAAMQGLGKPGSNIYSTTSGVPADRDFWFPGYSEGGISGRHRQHRGRVTGCTRACGPTAALSPIRSTAPRDRSAIGCACPRS